MPRVVSARTGLPAHCGAPMANHRRIDDSASVPTSGQARRYSTRGVALLGPRGSAAPSGHAAVSLAVRIGSPCGALLRWIDGGAVMDSWVRTSSASDGA